MEDESHAASVPESSVPPESAAPPVVERSPAEQKMRLLLIISLIVAGVFLLGLIALLVWLSMGAYDAAVNHAAPSPGSVVVSLLRDAAIIFVAFETLIIGVLLIILMVQVQSLVVLLRDEIRPMLEAANETLATVRGTTQFVSHSVVTPVMKWSGYLAGLQAIFREIGGLRKTGKEQEE